MASETGIHREEKESVKPEEAHRVPAGAWQEFSHGASVRVPGLSAFWEQHAVRQVPEATVSGAKERSPGGSCLMRGGTVIPYASDLRRHFPERAIFGRITRTLLPSIISAFGLRDLSLSLHITALLPRSKETFGKPWRGLDSHIFALFHRGRSSHVTVTGEGKVQNEAWGWREILKASLIPPMHWYQPEPARGPGRRLSTRSILYSEAQGTDACPA